MCLRLDKLKIEKYQIQNLSKQNIFVLASNNKRKLTQNINISHSNQTIIKIPIFITTSDKLYSSGFESSNINNRILKSKLIIN